MTATILQFLLASFLATGYWFYTPDESRADLESRYARAPSAFIEIEGVRVHFRDTGPRDAPVLIMLHGFGSSLHTWEPWAEALSDDYRVIRFDIPGFGLTGPDPSGDYTDTRAMQVLESLMDRLKVKQATLIGNSMGGRIAWTFAAEEPSRVTRLVLISPDGFASDGVVYGQPTELPMSAWLLPYLLPTPVLRMNLEPAYGDATKLTDDVVARYRDMMLVPGVRPAVLARMEQVVLEDPVPILKTLHIPVLLLWGEKDNLIPISNAADYMAALSDARLVTLPGLGHVPHEESPAESLEPVRAFLAREVPR